ncbi:MAG TPA: PIG-L family deacetylase [Microthrixaceae bacterium]|nr:PIG-L family deacetylase [Microthrixaceae bacterium]
MSTIVFFHAHPDDESIFTGGTIARLTDSGHRSIVVFATSGELGQGAGPELAAARRAEARAACAVLGAEPPVFLDHVDSGLSPDPTTRPTGAFADCRIEVVAGGLAVIAEQVDANALVTYDGGGIYGHPDHVHAHHVGRVAAGIAALTTWYEVTVDREHLHFVDTHVAALAGDAMAAHFVDQAPAVGLSTVEISTTVDVSGALDRKLRAIAAHRSQVGADPTFGAGAGFEDVYGTEWYVRHGERTVLDDLEHAVQSV